MSEYCLCREDPRGVLYYLLIPLLPICHQASVRLNLLHLYALAGRMKRILLISRRSQRRAVLSPDPVKAHFPSGVSETDLTSNPYVLAGGKSEYCLHREDPRGALYYPHDPVKAHLPSGVSDTEYTHLHALEAV